MTLEPQIPLSVESRIAALQKTYRNAATRIQNALLSGAYGPAESYRLSAQLQNIKAVKKALDAEARQIAKGIAKPAYQAGADFAREALNAKGVSAGVSGLGTGLNTSAIQVVSDQIAYDLLAANGSIEKNAVQLLRATQQTLIEESTINRAISRGVIEGATRLDVSNQIRSSLLKRVDKSGKVIVNGKAFDPDYYAELVARTRTREAMTQGTINTCSQYGVTRFQVSFHGDACDFCTQYEGEIFSTVDGDIFPVLTERPPFHPNCKHVLLPYIAVEGEVGYEESA